MIDNRHNNLWKFDKNRVLNFISGEWVNSSANPVIYSGVSRDFRKGMKNLCC